MAQTNSIPPFGLLDELEVLVLCEDSVMYESPCLGQHGLSLLVRARQGELRRSIAMDVGQNSGALLGNFALMGIDPAEIDGIVLSHCHYDHARGLAMVLRAIGKADLPVYAHAGIVNILARVSELCGTAEFENVLGGFHLVEASDEVIRKTCEGLAAFGIKALAPGHCTGFPAQVALRATFGERHTPLQTGMRIRVGSTK